MLYEVTIRKIGESKGKMKFNLVRCNLTLIKKGLIDLSGSESLYGHGTPLRTKRKYSPCDFSRVKTTVTISCLFPSTIVAHVTAATTV